MKKLMVTIVAITMAVVCNASSFIWGVDGGGEIYVPGSDEYLDYGTAMVYLGTVSASESAFNIGTAQLLAIGGYDEAADKFGNFDLDNLSTSDKLASTAAGQDYTVILLAKDDVTSLSGYEGDYVLYTAKSTEGTIPGTSGDDIKYADLTIANDGIPGDGWSKMSAVPEPTSGLLLLLGVAGLALRRRRA